MDEIQMENESPDEGLPLNEYMATIFEVKNEVIAESIRPLKVRKISRFSKYLVPVYKFINRHQSLLSIYNGFKRLTKPKRQLQIQNQSINYRAKMPFKSALTQQIKPNSNINQFNTFKDIQKEN
jgi:hypothetical protein